ncbi:MAG: 4-hydroxy-tetrahydrodipicolinate reductase [Clostridia bacterium]|nr:4-hydroxy-tetrahydrodipicolinate reductase [Clostridia bacterium]
MLNLLLSGASGHIGKKIAALCEKSEDFKVVCGVDRFNAECKFPVFERFDDVNIIPDVIVDFSNPSLLGDIIKFAKANKIPCILATTGYSKEQIELIKETSKEIPVFFTANMSLGINLLSSLIKKASAVLGDDFDVEIIEKHHNQKLDAPSGTALMLADAVNSVNEGKYSYEYDRHSKRQKRPKNEIGIHSVRGGTIVGEHEVVFAGNDEVISLSHTAFSKEVFAMGALRAAKFIAGKPAGLYDMSDILAV